MKLLRTLSIVSRRRWPTTADPAPTIGVPPPKKKAAAAPRAGFSAVLEVGDEVLERLRRRLEIEVRAVVEVLVACGDGFELVVAVRVDLLLQALLLGRGDVAVFGEAVDDVLGDGLRTRVAGARR